MVEEAGAERAVVAMALAPLLKTVDLTGAGEGRQEAEVVGVLRCVHGVLVL
jgi:hypothetical protein